MELYEKFLRDGDIGIILDSINELHAGVLVSCHGRGHALYVADTAEYILTATDCDARTVELGKIAGLLHDIGVIAGRWEHAKKSAALARVFLEGADCFSREEIDMLVQAIADHSDGENICSAIGAAVLIGDKSDLSRRRIFPHATLDPIYKNLMEMESVDINVAEKILTINFLVTKNFDEKLFIKDFTIDYWKGYVLPKKAAKFLGLECRFEVNGRTLDNPNSGIL